MIDNIYYWHPVKHIVLTLTKIIRSDGLTLNTNYIGLPYLFPVGNAKFGNSEVYLLTQRNKLSEVTISRQNAKL